MFLQLTSHTREPHPLRQLPTNSYSANQWFPSTALQPPKSSYSSVVYHSMHSCSSMSQARSCSSTERAMGLRIGKPFKASRSYTCAVASSRHQAHPHSSQVAWGQVASAVVVAAALQLGLQPAALATQHLTYNDISTLTYKEVKGSGLASTCPLISTSAPSTSSMPAGSYDIEQFCLEPTAFFVREEGEKEFKPTKVLTRQTYTLDMMTGRIDVGATGPKQLTLNEDGLDYAAVSLQPIPAGDYIPLMFTARNMNVKGDNGELQGSYFVPSYRGSSFMDPRGRGASTGYDYALGLAAAGDADEYQRTNNKNISPHQGEARLRVDVMDPDVKEVGGTFEMLQVSDDDMGAKESRDIAVVGVWYARVV